MFQISLKGVVVLFAKFFSGADKDAVLAAIGEGVRRVVFIDTPATSHLVASVEALVERGIEVVVYDHHDAPARSNPREVAIADAAVRVRGLCGGNAVISNRTDNPACSSLLWVGEFAAEVEAAGYGQCDGYCPDTPHTHTAPATVIVADPDPDGLTAAMKACGIVYDGLDADAAVLDGPRAAQSATTLSSTALLLVRAMSALPPFNAERPAVAENAKSALFADFVAMVIGDGEAKERLGKMAEQYEAGVAEAKRLAATASDVCTGVVLVDTVGSARSDLSTLTSAMEARPGCRITVIRKGFGPIASAETKAGRSGVQYSLAVVKQSQQEINLQELLPSGFESKPEVGIISNTSFLLHVSEQVWGEVVLPALTAKFGRVCTCGSGQPWATCGANSPYCG